MSKEAYAHPSDTAGTVYSVTYSDSRDFDRDVNYGYLQSLAAKGYTVYVDACPASASYVMLASDTLSKTLKGMA